MTGLGPFERVRERRSFQGHGASIEILFMGRTRGLKTGSWDTTLPLSAIYHPYLSIIVILSPFFCSPPGRVPIRTTPASAEQNTSDSQKYSKYSHLQVVQGHERHTSSPPSLVPGDGPSPPIGEPRPRPLSRFLRFRSGVVTDDATSHPWRTSGV